MKCALKIFLSAKLSLSFPLAFSFLGPMYQQYAQQAGYGAQQPPQQYGVQYSGEQVLGSWLTDSEPFLCSLNVNFFPLNFVNCNSLS